MVLSRTYLGLLAIFYTFGTAPLSTAKPLTKPERQVCKNVQHCLNILERHDFESFDYDVLSAEFNRFGMSGKKQLLKAMSGKNVDLSKHAAKLLSHPDFKFSADEINDIANQWPQGDVETLAVLMLKQYSPAVRLAAISTLTNTNEDIRFWSREILKLGEYKSEHSRSPGQKFEPIIAAFETLKSAALTDPTPEITNFIAQYPVEKSQPVLKVLLSTQSSGVVQAALSGLYTSDKDNSFKFLRESVSQLSHKETRNALALTSAIRSQYYETNDPEFVTFALHMLSDNSAGDMEALIGADILMGLERGPKLPDTEITMNGLENALAAHGTVPLFYLNGLQQKFGTQLDDGLNLLWNTLDKDASSNKLHFVSELTNLPIDETVLKILRDALEDEADWRVLVQAAEIAKVKKLSGLKPALNKLADSHPVIMARAAALAALGGLSNSKTGSTRTRMEWENKLKKEVKGCKVQPLDFKNDSKQLPYFSPTAIAYNHRFNRASLSTAVPTGNGWLAGYIMGEFSGGLVYYDNQTGAGELIYGKANSEERFTDDYVPNIFGILPKYKQSLGSYGDEYWAFTGLSHRGSKGAILSVSVHPDGIQVNRHFQLPKAPQALERLDDNSVLIGFGEKPNGKEASENLLRLYHPPLRLLPDGSVLPGCGPHSHPKTETMP